MGWGGKISGFALRVAGILHILELGPHNLTINEETMYRALSLAHPLKQHAAAAFGAYATDETSALAEQAFAWIHRQGLTSFTRSQFTVAMKNRGNLKERDAALRHCKTEISFRHQGSYQVRSPLQFMR